MSSNSPDIAIVDYGLGNIFSIRQACQAVGLTVQVTSSIEDILRSKAVILPGVGAFGKAMTTLKGLGLTDALHEVADSGKTLIGICLGMQLLMSVSYEFGEHNGLDLIPGRVVRFKDPMHPEYGKLKVPQVGWNQIDLPSSRSFNSWENTLFRGIPFKSYMYFLHSYHVQPENENFCFATSLYGDINFCSAIRRENVWGCQFHPERSGSIGLQFYKNLAAQLL